MTNTIVSLLGYSFWTLCLLGAVLLYRSFNSLVNEKAINDYKPDGSDLEGFAKRLTRVHANCYENFGIAAAVLLLAIVTEQTAVTESLALTFLAARIAQGVVHFFSTSQIAVLIRGSLLGIQIFILIYWVLNLASNLVFLI